MLQNPPRTFFPITWFAGFSSILPSVHAGPPQFVCAQSRTSASVSCAPEFP